MYQARIRFVPALIAAFAAASVLVTSAAAQEFQRGVAVVSEDAANRIPVFSYRAGPESELVLRSTTLAPSADGTAEVEFQDGRARVDADIRRAPEPASLGPYTVYVLWALTLEGRSSNLGFFNLSGGRGALEATVPLAQFALVVTAEPHFAVTIPSKAVVLQNFARDVKGRQETIGALQERADYSGMTQLARDPKKREPLELLQLRYAMAIANAVDAARFAAEPYGRAEALAASAERAQASKKSSERRNVAQLSREGIQAAEQARQRALIAKAEADGAAAAEAEAAKRTAAVEEEARRREAEAAVVAEENARKAAAAGAAEAAAKARADLTERLNRVLPTTDTPRGLVAQISGVQFATGAATLSVPARESLARFSGIVIAYQDMRFVVEGHTDNVGSEATNIALSTRRAITVRDFLIQQGVPASAIDVKGLGPAMPVADNATPQGRASNRRVEIVMSGGPIAR